MKDYPTMKDNSSLFYSTSFDEQPLLHRGLCPLRAFCVLDTSNQCYSVGTPQGREEAICGAALPLRPGMVAAPMGAAPCQAKHQGSTVPHSAAGGGQGLTGPELSME